MEISNDIINSLPQDPEASYTGGRPDMGNQYEIISKFAYLIGIRKNIFENDFEPPKLNIYEELEKEKKARIIRNLCILRNEMEQSFMRICNAIRDGHSIMTQSENISTELLEQLKNDGVDIYIGMREPNNFIMALNRNIKDRINNCRDLFPDWIKWEYLSDLFIMPDGLRESGIKKAAAFYYENKTFYPYKVYMNWPAETVENNGNILYCDQKFIQLLYKWHGEDFTDMNLVKDVTANTKNNIYQFIEQSNKCVFIVDCENSDPYNLCAALNGLNQERLSKIEKIVLFDDVHAASAWKILESYTNIPVEYILIERIKENKSLTDVRVTACACKEYYKNNVDSFVLVSSDSDYWGLIKELDGARFMVMVEHTKCSYFFKESLVNNGIFYCYLDDFYAGGGEDIKSEAIEKEIATAIRYKMSLNLDQLMQEILIKTRISMEADEINTFISRTLKPRLALDIDDDNNVFLSFRRK